VQVFQSTISFKNFNKNSISFVDLFSKDFFPIVIIKYTIESLLISHISVDTLYVGSDFGSRDAASFNGSLDEIRIDNTRLTSSQVATMYDAIRNIPMMTATPTPTAGPTSTPTPTPVGAGSTEVGYWKMDETSGYAVADSTSNARNGVAYNAYASNGGRNGYCRAFGGVDSFVSIPYNPNLAVEGDPFTLQAWVHPLSTVGNSDVVILSDIGYGASSCGGYKTYLDKNGVFKFMTAYVSGVNCNTEVVSGAGGTIPVGSGWHHTAVTRSGSTIKLYIDGELVTTGTINSITNNGRNLYIGAEEDKRGIGFPGMIDDVKIDRRTFTYAEVQTSYINTQAMPTATSAPAPTSSVTITPNGYTCNGGSAPYGTPELFQINTASTSATLFFKGIPANGNNLSYYYVAYGQGEKDEQYGGKFDTTTTGGVMNYKINLLAPSTKYTFKIRAGNGCMPGNWGNKLAATTTNGENDGEENIFYLFGKNKFNRGTSSDGQAELPSTGFPVAAPLIGLGLGQILFSGFYMLKDKIKLG
jgi:hypothetical protein